MLYVTIGMVSLALNSGCRHLKPVAAESKGQEELQEASDARKVEPEGDLKEGKQERPEDPLTLPIPNVDDPFLIELLQPEEHRLPAHLRRVWPYSSWSSAKIYAFNFVSSQPGAQKKKYHPSPWTESTFQGDIVQERLLTEAQAEAALELIHRTAGGQVMTKCPLFARHAVVFFNAQEEAIGWNSICFECSDSISYPQYFLEDQEQPFLFGLYQSSDREEAWSFGSLYDEVFDKWEHLFEELEVPRYLPNE